MKLLLLFLGGALVFLYAYVLGTNNPDPVRFKRRIYWDGSNGPEL